LHGGVRRVSLIGPCCTIVQQHELQPQYGSRRAMDIARLVQSSIAPVFLFTGVAATLGVLTNRLARIVDRARTLEERLESHPGSAQPLQSSLEVLARRARYINFAISLCAI